MINYLNFKEFRNKFLITNDFGRYEFLEKKDFISLLCDRLSKDSELRKRLIDNGFIYDEEEQFTRFAPSQIFSSKNYLYKSTSLHIFVVTSACNQQCIYCQAQNGEKAGDGFMTIEVAEKAVDIALQSPSDNLDFEFQGGEPLLNFEIIKHIVEYSKIKSKKHINYSLVTNLTLLTEEMINFIKDNNISISTSLDGDAFVHNSNRPYRTGKGTFTDVKEKIEYLKNIGINVGAIQTTTKFSLDKYKEIVDEYVSLGFESIFIRPLTPLGCANVHWNNIGYTAENFVDFYRKSLDYIIEKNRQGYKISEGHAKILITKILSGFSENYMELRSPCGAVLGQLAYYYDGNIFTCDEGRMLHEMGDSSFCVGNVKSSNYESIVNSKVCSVTAKASILESNPSCSDCVYQPYCGTCPVVNYAMNNNLIENSPQEYKCKTYSGILETIFNYLYDNKEVEDIFWRWIE